MMPSLLIDSGAFTEARRKQHGKPVFDIDRDAYIEYLLRNKHLIAQQVALDVIPLTPWTPDGVEESANRSYENFLRMKAAGLSPIPCFHQGERFEWLERYVKDGESYIGISAAHKNRKAIAWYDQCFEILPPRVNVHGFGLTSHLIMSMYRWASVDSRRWHKAAGHGKIIVPRYAGAGRFNYSVAAREIYITDDTREHRNHFDDLDLDCVARKYVCRYLNDVVGIELAEARYSLHHRLRCWLTYFLALQADLHPMQIYFVTDLGRAQALVLNELGVQNRLLSYFKLRDAPEDALENYVLPTPPDDRSKRRADAVRNLKYFLGIKVKCNPTLWGSPTYLDRRKYQMFRRLKMYERKATETHCSTAPSVK